MPDRPCLDAIVATIAGLAPHLDLPDLPTRVYEEAAVIVEREDLAMDTDEDCRRLLRILVPIGYDLIRRSAV